MEANKRIEQLRFEYGFRRKEFADYFGIPIRTLEDWEAGKRTPPSYVVRLIAYQLQYSSLKKAEEKKNRNVNVISDTNGNKVVVIHDTIFMGKQNISWRDVEAYLRRYVGEFYSVMKSKDIIYIGKDLPDEYANSKYTAKLMGTAAKAKANAVQAIPELLQTATNKVFTDNYESKHEKNAKYGWYRFDARFALAVYDKHNEIQKYNVFKVRIIVRHAEDGKKYLYDIINIKKETEYPA